MEIHKILGEKVSVYRRENSSKWHCATSLKGKQYRKSTKQVSLSAAKDVAEDWYKGVFMKLLTAAALTLVISSCAAFDVSQDFEANKGVPFYLKKGQFTQTTIYTRSWFDVTLVIETIGDKAKELLSTTVHMSLEKCDTGHIQKALDSAHDDLDVTKTPTYSEMSKANAAFIESLTTDKCIIPLSKLLDEIKVTENVKLLKQDLISNNATYQMVADFENIYYFNSIVPFFASASANIELATDGSLTKASANIDTTKLADVIPVNAIITDMLLPTAPEAPFMEPPPAKTRLYIKVTLNGYNYSFQKTFAATSPQLPSSGLDSIKFGSSSALFTRTPFSNSKKQGSKPAKNTVLISGSIKLPDPK